MLSLCRCDRQTSGSAFGLSRSLVRGPYGHFLGQRAGRARRDGRLDDEAVDSVCLVCHALARGRGSVVNGRRVYSRLPQRARAKQVVDAAALAHQEQSLASDPEHSHCRPAALPTMVASRYQGKPTTATGRRRTLSQPALIVRTESDAAERSKCDGGQHHVSRRRRHRHRLQVPGDPWQAALAGGLRPVPGLQAVAPAKLDAAASGARAGRRGGSDACAS